MNNLSRQLVVLAGEPPWQRATAQQLLADHATQSLWVGEDAPAQFSAVSLQKAHHWLGSEQLAVVFDANRRLDVDALAAVSGVIVGGGVLLLLMPAVANWSQVYASRFGQRFVQALNAQSWIHIVSQASVQQSLPALRLVTPKTETPVAELTAHQQQALTEIMQQASGDDPVPVVLVSDRGRGKSATLGMAAAKLLTTASVKKIIVTAPRLDASEVLFKHAGQLLPQAQQQRGHIAHGEAGLEFMAPDALLHDTPAADLLLVDEAAAIPVPLLSRLLQHYPRVVFATTVHGYEGTGRGFALRFQQVLQQQAPGWQKLQLQIPIRWAPADPLERWLFDVLCLDAEIVAVDELGEINIDELQIELLERDQLLTDDKLLTDVFALLVLAHYRTRPGDLVRLMDDPAISLYIAVHQARVLAVCLVVREGQFPAALANAVYRGERRPKGHLLAQTLAYHCAVENAAQADYARIMRIAVHPELQRHGIGHRLMAAVVANEQYRGRDAIGASFGVTDELLSFWQQSGFHLLRIGFTREQSSGEHAAIVMRGLTATGEAIQQQAQQQFREQLSYWLQDVLQDLSPEVRRLLDTAPVDNQAELTVADRYLLQLFVSTSRAYELCIAPINKLVLSKAEQILSSDFPENSRRVLRLRVTQRLPWQRVVAQLNLSGKAEAQQLLRDAVQRLV